MWKVRGVGLILLPRAGVALRFYYPKKGKLSARSLLAEREVIVRGCFRSFRSFRFSERFLTDFACPKTKNPGTGKTRKLKSSLTSKGQREQGRLWAHCQQWGRSPETGKSQNTSAAFPRFPQIQSQLAQPHASIPAGWRRPPRQVAWAQQETKDVLLHTPPPQASLLSTRGPHG